MKFAKKPMSKNHRNHLLSLNATAYALLTCLFLIPPNPATAQYAGGNGDPNTPFLIETAEQLNNIGLHPEHWNKHFKLIADINIAGYTGTLFNIIGSQSNPFTGVFDGNGYTIYNFRYFTTEDKYIGLFGRTGAPARIQNLRLENVDIDAGSSTSVGGLVALNYADIINCQVSGIVETHKVGLISAFVVGGLIGDNISGSITNCSFEGHVYGYLEIGGLIGNNNYGTISNCHTSGSVNGTEQTGGLIGCNYGDISRCYSHSTVNGMYVVGGLIGHNGPGAWTDDPPDPMTVCECYATGDVYGERSVGGLIGSNYGLISHCYAHGGVIATGNNIGGLVGFHDTGYISYSYAKGLVSSPGSDVGGFVGENRDIVYESFWNIDTSGQTHSGGGIGKTNVQMTTIDTYVNWGYQQLWTIGDGHPHLLWENVPGDLISTPLPTYGGGSGTSANPYHIKTAWQLNTIGTCPFQWDKHFILCNDIDMHEYQLNEYNIIGLGYQDYEFTGVFDGKHNTISNFCYAADKTNNLGLFGVVNNSNTVIKNLNILDPNIVSTGESSSTGSLVGLLKAGTIDNCHVISGRVDGHAYVGGLAGTAYSSDIMNCSADTNVSGNMSVGGSCIGGLLGYNGGNLTKSSAAGSVVGGNHVGGLVGFNFGSLTYSSATATVSGSYYIGGMVGKNEGPLISNCGAAGPVNGGDYLGGLVGKAYDSKLICNSYATGNVSGNNNVGGLIGIIRKLKYSSNVNQNLATGLVTGNGTYVGGFIGCQGSVIQYDKNFWNTSLNPGINGIGNGSDPDVIGETTANLKKTSTFINVGWDFVDDSNGDLDYWRMCVDDLEYPKLSWQATPGDLLCPDGVGLIDLAYYCAHWLDAPCDDANNYCHRTDLNHDGRNNLLDYLILAQNYLKN